MTYKNVPLEFEPWYRAEYPRMVNSVALVCGDRSLASEAAAEAFTRALVRWRRVSRMDQPTGWVYRVALNDARRRLRRSSQERRLYTKIAPTLPSVAPPIEGDHELWAAVARLPERTRAVVVLRYVADLTEPAIAEALGIKRGTVATTLQRAHQRLARELTAQPVSPPTIPRRNLEMHHVESH